MSQGNQDRVKAKHRERMIEVKVRFWTNDIAEGRGYIRPKHAWASGVVRMERNESHGIIPKKPIIFHSLMDIPAKIEKALIDHGIVLHGSDKMDKYFPQDNASQV